MSVFKNYSAAVNYQNYEVNENEYKNVICSFGIENKKRIIIGAHYDVCGDQEGADDNASGVVGLLELARLLNGKELNYRIDLVAYSLEEPPFFKTESMGSFIHAKYLFDKKIDVYGMLSLEMIGYFTETENSQSYPLGLLSWFYGTTGNYIALIKKFGAGSFANKFSKAFVARDKLTSKVLTAPKFLEGIDFSDHLNYWHFGYSALMLTDTAFFRNTNYHKKSDTMETLNLEKMALVIDGVLEAVLSLGR